MYWQRINYYGFEKKRYEDCKDLIKATNYKHLLIINSWLFLLSAVSALFCLLNKLSFSESSLSVYSTFAIISLFFEAALIFLKKICTRNSILLAHLSILLSIMFGIYSSLSSPALVAALYLVIMVVASVTYLDTMVRITVLLIFYNSVFLFTSFEYKTPTIAMTDVYNSIVILILSLTLHFTFQNSKMNQLYSLQKNIQFQHDFEIRSSFDTLTNLLDVTRFFTIADQMIKEFKNNGEIMAIAILDLDKFKEINEYLGHQMGDKAIQTAANIIADKLNMSMLEKWSFAERAVNEKLSIAGRLSGAEYILLIRGHKDIDGVKKLLQEILDALNEVNMGELHGIKGCFGASAVKTDDKDTDTVYKRAEEALFHSKEAGENCITIN